jgi:hypothetical protein
MRNADPGDKVRTPSPGTPGEGGGEGSESAISDFKFQTQKILTLTLSRSTGRGDKRGVRCNSATSNHRRKGAAVLAFAVFMVAGLLTVHAAQDDAPPAPGPATAPTTSPTDASVRFGALDVFVDTGEEPLAAYQVEWKATAGDVTLVGIEGGEHAAYREPPYYDPKALSGGRVIVGAFNTGMNLPRGRTRVARLMVRVRGDVAPAYAATVQAAAGADARAIAAKVSVSEREANAE